MQLAFAGCIAVVVALQAQGPVDFKVFWAAQHTTTPYDPAAIAKVLGPGLRPFSYPPTFLFLTEPLSWIDQRAGYVTWVALSAIALVASLRRPLGPLVLFAPAVFLAGIIGQTSLFMAAALFAAATTLSRPVIAGALFGLAACIKPQAVVLVPIVLIAGGHWRALWAAAITGILLCLTATAAYGFHVWMDWYASLGGFLEATDAAWKGRYLSLPGAWRLLALAVGVIGAWRLRADPERATGLAVAAALLGSLYALDYDAAMLAPFALSAALRGGWAAVLYVIFLVIPPSSLTVALFSAASLAEVFGKFRRGVGRAAP
jgi:hypothetical protein